MMLEGLLTMSKKELHRHEVIKRVSEGELTQSQASKLLQITVRQLKRLCRAYRIKGAEGLISEKRGKMRNHVFKADSKEHILQLARTAYRGFGPTFMAEKLLQREGFKVSKETLRGWLIKEGLWSAKKSRRVIHQSRERRDCMGELIQVDGSPHDWFEGRAPKCCLIVFIDDATSELLYLHFEEAETSQAYFRGLFYCIKYYGLPISIYSDKHSIFRVNNSSQLEVGLTQFERACKTLRVECIHANSPQAKGRVERSNKTHQDRLVKELRLHNISDIAAANAYLETYRLAHNKRFAKTAKQPTSLFVTNRYTDEHLLQILSVQEKRKVSKNLEISFKNKIFQLQDKGQKRRLQQSEITVCETMTNQIYLIYQGKELEYKIFNQKQAQATIADDKTLNSHVDKIVSKKVRRPKKSHPWFNTPLTKKGHLSYQQFKR